MRARDLGTVGAVTLCVFITADAFIGICGHFLDGAVTLRVRLYPAIFLFELLGYSLMIAGFVITHRSGGKRR